MSNILTITESDYTLLSHEITILNDFYILSSSGYMAYLRKTKRGFTKKINPLYKDVRGKNVNIQVKIPGEKLKCYRLNRLIAKYFLPSFKPSNYIGFIEKNEENFHVDNLFSYIGKELFFYEMHYNLLIDPSQKQIDYYQTLLDEKELNITKIETENPDFEKLDYD